MLSEYILILWNYIKAIYLKPPLEWKSGEKGNVILVMGYAENFVFLETIGKFLNKRGYKVWIVPTSNPFNKIESEVTKIEAFIKQSNLNNLIFVSHSRGGLIAKLLVDTNPDIAQTTKRLIAISTPWQGTKLGYLHFGNLYEVKPNSKVIQKVLKNKSNLGKITNLYPKLDNHVIPNNHLLLADCDNHEINVVGHTKILEVQETLEIIQKILLEHLKTTL